MYKNNKIYENVIKQIKKEIINGTLKKGQKFPPEREMAERLGVSRTSIREAIRALEVIGLVESRQGAGNYIKESFENSLIEPLSIMFLLQQSNPMEVAELRRILEVETVVLAVDRIEKSEIIDLEGIVEKMKTSTDEWINVALDKEFHHVIAKASKNFLFINISLVLSQLIDEFIKGIRKEILSKEENREKLIKIHETVIEAMKLKNKDMAREAMEEHFLIIDENIFCNVK